LRDPDPDVRKSIADLLTKVFLSGHDPAHDPRIAPALKDALSRRDNAVIAGAFAQFLRIGEPGPEDALIEALQQNGDRWMAEGFEHCGNEELARAGDAWMTDHNLTPSQSSGLLYFDRWPQWGEAH
jgi:hypothetical protein